jgi:hypothetical protein
MSGQLVVARPPDVVFDVALDEPAWNPAMTSLDWLTAPPAAAGSRYRAVMGGRMQLMAELTDVDRPHRIGSRTTSAMMTTEGAVTFAPSGTDATLLSWDWTYRLHGATWLLAPIFGVLGARWERRNWARLRDHVERLPTA